MKTKKMQPCSRKRNGNKHGCNLIKLLNEFKYIISENEDIFKFILFSIILILFILIGQRYMYLGIIKLSKYWGFY